MRHDPSVFHRCCLYALSRRSTRNPNTNDIDPALHKIEQMRVEKRATRSAPHKPIHSANAAKHSRCAIHIAHSTATPTRPSWIATASLIVRVGEEPPHASTADFRIAHELIRSHDHGDAGRIQSIFSRIQLAHPKMFSLVASYFAIRLNCLVRPRK